MTQDLFVPACAEEQALMSASIPNDESWGINWHKLSQIWLTALSDRSVLSDGWALFMSVDTDHPKFIKERRKFDLFVLNQGEHPIWTPRCTYRSVFGVRECPEWAEFSEELDLFYRERPTDLPFGFNDDVEWFVDCLVNRIALDTLQKVNWRSNNTVGNHFSSPNTCQNFNLRPLHPSGGQLFAASRGATYEQAINFLILYSRNS